MDQPTNIDPETGTISWDVKYQADFGSIYKIFKKLHDEYKKFIGNSEVKTDDKLIDISKSVDTLYNKFRSHLRKNYPTQYSKLKTVNEVEFKNSIFQKLKEESSTGTGTSFNAGEGEQYATPFAFGKYKYKLKDGWKPAPVVNENRENDENYINSLNITDPELKQFIEKRVAGFTEVENKLNELVPLFKQAKAQTLEFYKQTPDFKVLYGTDLAVDYLNDIIKMFKDNG